MDRGRPGVLLHAARVLQQTGNVFGKQSRQCEDPQYIEEVTIQMGLAERLSALAAEHRASRPLGCCIALGPILLERLDS